MNFKFVVCGLALAAGSLSAAAEVYKWKDASGRTVYSDRPPVGAPAQKLDVRTGVAVAREASAPAVGQAVVPSAASGASLQQEAAQLNKKVEDYNRRMRADNCSRAKTNLERAEAAKPRSEAILSTARKDMKEWCGS
ncbi:DUF4124 domain-containing protein [Craterilacuibacter sp. RT1T]|uniref:DUF4124 domain-containing protein n=1 Tax=Craterilacuibacter sp. RT1T TaxID=2942211 RepID=UPI0020BFB8B1|nr:DUF4124 domain-containing protein [Craterilacuibacter sp. RT1T]MCL6262133.1 DUF4124 domain-containing protein [Craterilacuibacter sp. RT1T]